MKTRLTINPPGGTLHKPPILGPLNELLGPLGFEIMALNGWSVTIIGDGFRQEAIRVVYGYYRGNDESKSN